MQRYVALLGSINVGGNRLKMADLREALEREDFADVETVVASGNVLFSHEERPSEGLAEKIAYVVGDRFGIDTFAAVRSRDELAASIADNPFAEDGEPNQVHTVFLHEPLDRAAFERIRGRLFRPRAPRPGNARDLRRLLRWSGGIEARPGDAQAEAARHRTQHSLAQADARQDG